MSGPPQQRITFKTFTVTMSQDKYDTLLPDVEDIIKFMESTLTKEQKTMLALNAHNLESIAWGKILAAVADLGGVAIYEEDLSVDPEKSDDDDETNN